MSKRHILVPLLPCRLILTQKFSPGQNISENFARPKKGKCKNLSPDYDHYFDQVLLLKTLCLLNKVISQWSQMLQIIITCVRLE